jgi:hypothetical protein
MILLNWNEMRRPFRAYTAVALLLPALTLEAGDPLYESARRKLDLIEAGKVPRGSVINFPPQEINAWARVRVPEIVPEGIRDMRVELGVNTAVGYAIVNFLKMRQAQGASTNWLISKVIEGERPLKVSVRLESSNGRCTVFLTGVELSNVSANRTVLDFLLTTFFKPLYPDAKINEPFDLDYNIDRLEIRPSGARVTIKR